MKTIGNVRLGIAVFLFICVITGLYAQDNELRREISRSFEIDNATKLEIDNIYGNVNIMNHEVEKVDITVVIQVNIRDRNRAEEVLRMIDVAIKKEGDIISAETQINDNLSRLFRGINIGGGDIEINYNVYMPSDVPLTLNNKYGNIFIDGLVSTSTIDLKYGKLHANQILHNSSEPLTRLLLAYSDANIQEANWINIDMKYSKLNIVESKALVMVSRYSKIFITRGTSLVCDSKYDSFELGNFNNFVITTSYTNIKINELTGRLQTDTRYSDVMVARVPSGFESIRINNSYGNYRINIDQSASYKIDAQAKYCNIVIPDNRARVNRISENSELKINGFVGEEDNSSSIVNVNSSYGNIRLTQ